MLLEGTPELPLMPKRVLSAFIAFARDNVQPKLTEASHAQLASSYVELRRARGSGKTVSATLRQLESMIRLSESRARMRFSSIVTVEDVIESKRLISAALKEAATDPRTGLISLDMFSAPDPHKGSMESCMAKLGSIIERRYIAIGRKTATVHELRLALSEAMVGMRPLPPTQFIELLALMSGGELVASFTATTVTFGGAAVAST